MHHHWFSFYVQVEWGGGGQSTLSYQRSTGSYDSSSDTSQISSSTVITPCMTSTPLSSSSTCSATPSKIIAPPNLATTNGYSQRGINLHNWRLKRLPHDNKAQVATCWVLRQRLLLLNCAMKTRALLGKPVSHSEIPKDLFAILLHNT